MDTVTPNFEDNLQNDSESDDRFMEVARSTSKNSKDPRTKVGAVIVNKENEIVGTGYSKMPNGCEDGFSWSWHDKSKQLYVCHAEMNAIVCKDSAVELKNCRIYTTLFPCNECAKIIIQAGIIEVIYSSGEKNEKKKYGAAKRLLDAAGIKCRQYQRRSQEESQHASPENSECDNNTVKKPRLSCDQT